jgi:hypothetical protein
MFRKCSCKHLLFKQGLRLIVQQRIGMEEHKVLGAVASRHAARQIVHLNSAGVCQSVCRFNYCMRNPIASADASERALSRKSSLLAPLRSLSQVHIDSVLGHRFYGKWNDRKHR